MSMSINSIPSIEILPVELFHRIFDNLDTQTILFSIRPVCRLFRSIIDTYNRYILNFELISKSNFYCFCYLIHPENIITLKFSNDQQTSNHINLFISLVSLKQFTRLRSLTLFNIDEGQLNFSLKSINLNTLNSFSFNIRKYCEQHKKATISLLSSIISQSSLRKLEFSLKSDRMSKILWSVNCKIQYLTINSYINIDNLYNILQYSPHLHTLILSEISSKEQINNLNSIKYFQLKSLTIDELCITIDEFESFLLLTPSLIHLKLIAWKQMLNGKRWEEFIQKNLCQLNKFEFYFSECRSIMPRLTDIELILSSFQTSFWIENKKWFVTCEYDNQYPKIIYLYSLPLCKSSICYVPDSEKISLSTYPIMINNNLSKMENITSLRLDLNKSLANDIQEKKTTVNHVLFPKVNEISLQFCIDWPVISLEILSIFFDISRINQVKIISNYFKDYNQNTWIDISNFMKQACNLSSLIIEISFLTHLSIQTIENIHSILPYHIKYLQIPINSLDQINRILERCQNLSIIKFIIEDVKFSKQVIRWFDDNTINTTCQEDYGIVTIWLGYKKHPDTIILE